MENEKPTHTIRQGWRWIGRRTETTDMLLEIKIL